MKSSSANQAEYKPLTRQMKEAAAEWAMRDPGGVIALAVDALPPKDLRRLLEHVDRRTPICCGKKLHFLYADGAGAFSIELLCDYGELPRERLEEQLDSDPRAAPWHARLAAMQRQTQGLYSRAIESATEDDVRLAIQIVCRARGIEL